MAEGQIYCQCYGCKETFEVDVELIGHDIYVMPEPRIQVKAGRIIHHCGGNGHTGEVKAFLPFADAATGAYRVRRWKPENAARGCPRRLKHIFEPSS